MGKSKWHQMVAEQAKAKFNLVPEEVREDLAHAVIWAVNTLMQKEGAGHMFQIHPDRGDALCSCSFSKPSWSGEHVGSDMPTGSEAVVMAVCEYLCGG